MGGGVPHVQSSLSATSSHYSQKLIKYKTDTIYHSVQPDNRMHTSPEMSARGFIYTFYRLCGCCQLTSGRPVGSTENLSWRYKKVHIATTNKDLFTLFNGLLLIKGWSLTMDEMKPETQTKCHFLRYIKEAILFPFTKAWFWFWGLLICLNVFHIFVIVEAPRFPMKAGFCH